MPKTPYASVTTKTSSLIETKSTADLKDSKSAMAQSSKMLNGLMDSVLTTKKRILIQALGLNARHAGIDILLVKKMHALSHHITLRDMRTSLITLKQDLQSKKIMLPVDYHFSNINTKLSDLIEGGPEADSRVLWEPIKGNVAGIIVQFPPEDKNEPIIIVAKSETGQHSEARIIHDLIVKINNWDEDESLSEIPGLKEKILTYTHYTSRCEQWRV